MGAQQSTADGTEPGFEWDPSDESIENESKVKGKRFKRGDQVMFPDGKYIGARVAKPTKPGGDVTVSIPITPIVDDLGVGGRSLVNVVLKESDIPDSIDDSVPTQRGNDDTMADGSYKPPASLIGCPGSGRCCHSGPLMWQPKRVLASLFCSLTGCSIIYILVA